MYQVTTAQSGIAPPPAYDTVMKAKKKGQESEENLQDLPPPDYRAYNESQSPPQPSIATIWMPRPARIANCPPGFEYLAHLDKLLVHQNFSRLSSNFSEWERRIIYDMKNFADENVFLAAEESDQLEELCCRSSRRFRIHLVDESNRKIIRMERKRSCFNYFSCCCCCFCWVTNRFGVCSDEVHIEAPVYRPLGYVRKSYNCLNPKYTIFDSSHRVQAKIRAPWGYNYFSRCLKDKEFEIYSPESNEKVGKIQKNYLNIKNAAVYKDDMDLNTKALLLGALFMIGFMVVSKEQSQMAHLMRTPVRSSISPDDFLFDNNFNIDRSTSRYDHFQIASDYGSSGPGFYLDNHSLRPVYSASHTPRSIGPNQRNNTNGATNNQRRFSFMSNTGSDADSVHMFSQQTNRALYGLRYW